MSSVSEENTQIKPLRGSPIQIVNFRTIPGRQSQLILEKKALKHILLQVGDRPVYVLSIAGASRQGKSFLLTIILHLLESLSYQKRDGWEELLKLNSLEGFHFENGTERQTVGMWLWSTPFFFRQSDGTDIAVLLMDSQGVFDEHTNKRDWSMIVGLNLLTSSCLIYNLFNNLQEDNLEIFHNFVEFGMLSLTTNPEASNVFQKLIFMIRDWNFPNTNPYGLLGGSRFLEEKLRIKPTMPGELKTVRSTLRTCFEEMECFLLPNPGDAAKSNDFKGALRSLNPEFLNNLEVFAENLLVIDDMKPKVIGGQVIRGLELLSYFDKYITAFNEQTLPKAVTLLEATMDARLETLTNFLILKYSDQIDEIRKKSEFLTSKELTTFHEEYCLQANVHFSSEAKASSRGQLDKHRGHLTNELLRLLHVHLKSNDDNKSAFLYQLLDRAMIKYKCLIDPILQEKVCLRDELHVILDQAKSNVMEDVGTDCGQRDAQFLIHALPQLESILNEMDKEYISGNSEKFRSTESKFEVTLQQLSEDYSRTMTQALSIDDKMTMEKLQQTHRECESHITEKLHSCLTSNNQKLNEFFFSKFQVKIKSLLVMYADKVQLARKNASYEAEQILINTVDTYKAAMITFLNKAPSESEITTHHSIQSLTATNRFMSSILQNCDKKEVQRLQQKLEELIKKTYQQMLEQVENNRLEFQKRWQDEVNVLRQKYLAILSTYEGPKLSTQDELKANHKVAVIQIMNTIDELGWLPPSHRNQFQVDINNILDGTFSDKLISNSMNIEQVEMEVRSAITDEMSNYLKEMHSKMLEEGISIHQLEEGLISALSHAIKSIQLCSRTLPSENTQSLLSSLESKFQTSFNDVRKTYEMKIDGKRAEAMGQIPYFVRSYQSEMETISCSIEFPTQDQLKRWHIACKNRVEHQMEGMFLDCSGILNISEIKNAFNEEINEILKNRMEEALVQQKGVENQISILRQDILNNYRSQFSERLSKIKSDGDLGIIRKDLFIIATHTFETRFPPQNNLKQFRQEKQILERELETTGRDFVKQFQETSTRFDADTRNTILEIVDEQNSKMEKAMSNFAFLPDYVLNEIHSDATRNGLAILQAMEKPPTAYPNEYEKMLMQHLNDKFEFHQRQNESKRIEVEEEVDELTENLKREFFNDLQTIKGPEPNISSLKSEYIRKCKLEVKEKYNVPEEALLNHICQAKMEKVLNEVHDEWKNMEPDEKILKKGITKAEKAYYKDMDLRTNFGIPGNHRHPKVLEELHRKATKEVRTVFVDSVKQTEASLKMLEDSLKLAFQKYIDDNDMKAAEISNPAIGIDLGTTYSCVSVYRNGRTEIIPDQNNHAKVTPSYILFESKNNIVVGDSAKEQAFVLPEKTIFDAKRLIGRKYNDPKTQQDILLWPFHVVNDEGSPKIKVDDEIYRPEEVSSELLKKLKRDAEKHLGCIVQNAVITVPAYFNDAQRVATKNAGASAGLIVLGLLNEPTSAAIAYSLNYTDGKQRNVLVYDLGGGTFDVSILSIKGGDIEVKAVGGNNHLGGKDFDNNILNFCTSEFQNTNGISLLTTGTKPEINTRLRRIRDRCERAKITLSVSKVAEVMLELICNQLHLKVKITREDFNHMNEALMQETIQIVSKTLQDAKLDKSKVDDVVLVGGSTRIPRVQELLEEFFMGKQLNMTLDPDEVVARGAAIFAAMKNGSKERELGHINFTDVTPLSLGIEAIVGNVKGVFSILIQKNTQVPVSKTQTYFTTANHQTEISVKVYEGEDNLVVNNNLLGSFLLKDIPPGLAGSEKIEVTISCNREGILHVKAFCKSTGGNKEIIIESNR